MTLKRNALGRGLGALLENAGTDITSKSKTDSEEKVMAGSVSNLLIQQIEANPFNPRTHFEKEALEELTSSIRQHGIIQPVTVRKMGYDKYQLISGERRFKASTAAGLTHIPAYIRVANDQSMLEMALVENIQREDLDAVEIALSYQRLLEECNLTQEQLSEKVSKQRSTISNFLRLLKLPAEIQLGIRHKEISVGHARALVSIADEQAQMKIFQDIITHQLSVRQTEELMRGNTPQTAPSKKSKKTKHRNILSVEERKMLEEIGALLGTQIELKRQNDGAGKLLIAFSSDADLQRILKTLER
ncbi:MAG TPA: ParB/RepB/Spo0J family partition protein [Bacteroidia bacterium]|jgi:ParB family chromosome partitioning protein|nr:ParB/RepB/Spo0J family partition protein [Bacteroidia bacterium]